MVRVRNIEAARTPPWWQLSTQATVAVLSEPMTDIEVMAFERQWGYAPTFIYSDQGQRTVAKRGYTPLPASLALHALRELSR